MNRLLRAGLAPMWALQTLSGAHSFVGNPILGSRRLNEAGLHVWRVRAAYALAERRRAALVSTVAEADRVAFAQDGFIRKNGFLPADHFDALKDEIARFDGPEREMVQGDAITRRIALDPANLARLPAAKRLIELPSWRAPIDYVGSFRMEPMTYVQTILSKANTLGPDPQTFLHQDTFHPTVKAWLFLDDVPVEAGPFLFVRGSHRLTPERLAWERRMSLTAATDRNIFTALGSFRIDRSELAALNLPQPEAIAVEANTLIVADTFGLHARGPSVKPSTRMEVWAYGRPNPFWPFLGPDFWSLTPLRHRKAQMFWASMDALERLRLGRNHWRPRQGRDLPGERRQSL